jgi:hypothetical protein
MKGQGCPLPSEELTRPFAVEEKFRVHCYPSLKTEGPSDSGVVPVFERTTERASSSPTLAEFVERSFIPEFVATKKSAGRDHFKAILKHVLPPEQVARLFTSRPGKVSVKLSTIPDWPYLGSLG